MNPSTRLTQLFHLCQASGGSVALIRSSVQATVQGGGLAVSNGELARISAAVREAWQTSGGSAAAFEAGLKRRLGQADGGRQFLAALSLACTLQGLAAPCALAADIYVGNGQTSTGDVLAGGGYVSMFVSSGGTANSTAIHSGGVQIVFSGGTANSATVNSHGSQVISSGGTASATTANSYGSQVISSGGTASATILNSYGFQFISSGGMANATTVTGGGQYIYSGGTANATTVNAYGSQFVSSGGTANTTTVNSHGSQFVSSGGTASATTVSGGSQVISSGGTASATALISGGVQLVSSGGHAYNTTVNAGGRNAIDLGGLATSTTVNSGGSQSIYAGGTANTTTVNADGSQVVQSGGMANSTTVNADGSQIVHSGGSASATTLSGGTQIVSSGGHAYTTTVQAGGSQVVLSGGSAAATTVNSGGTLSAGHATASLAGVNAIRDGGVLLGNGLTLAAGATLELERNADATQATAFSGAGGLVKTGTGTLTLTGANTYTGGTTVSAGTLAGDTASLRGPIDNRAAVVFNQAAAGTYAGIMSGAGRLTKEGAGTLTLTGVNTYTGPTEVRVGTLALGATGSLAPSLATGGLVLNGGAGFDFSALGASLAIPKLTVRGAGSPAVIDPGSQTANFSGATLSYFVPPTAVDGDTLLSVPGAAAIDATTAVHLAYASGRPNINLGEKFVLLDASALNANGVTQLTMQTVGGDTFIVQVSGNQLQAILQSLAPTGPAYERLKAYAESRTGALSLTNQSLDLLLHQGLGSAIAVTQGRGFKADTFGGIGGGRSRYETGSHVSVSGATFLAGIAAGNDLAGGRLTLGGFFESGRGNYHAYNSFANAAPVNGKGDADHYGGGVLGRYDLSNGVYLDASARFGRTSVDFRTNDIQYNGQTASFKTNAHYYGLHGGAGYAQATAWGRADVSVRVLWTRMAGDNLTVYQDRLRFDTADSLRVRLGGRFFYTVESASVTPYAGLYGEYEFDGRQRLSVNGNAIDSPLLRGGTAVGEAGLYLKSSPSRPLTLDLGVQGYAGRREGVAGSLRVRYDFY